MRAGWISAAGSDANDVGDPEGMLVGGCDGASDGFGAVEAGGAGGCFDGTASGRIVGYSEFFVGIDVGSAVGSSDGFADGSDVGN